MFKRSGAGNYAYTAARVKAKKSKLLKEEDYNKLLMMTVPEISHYISDAGYSKEMTDLAARYSGISLVEYATYTNMAKQFRSILSSATGDLSRMVAAYLTKWDFENLKTILRGKNYGLTIDDIKEDLVPAGSLGTDDLEKIISAPSIEDALALFKSKTGISVSDEALNAYKEEGVLTKIEDEISKGYYKSVLASIEGRDRATSIFRNYFKYVIDAKNIETLLKLKVENVSSENASEFFIPGGYEVNQKVFSQIAAAPDFQSALNETQQLKIYSELKDSLNQNATIMEVVNEIDKYKIKLANQVAHMYPLSVIPVVEYMIHKEIEVRNIRMIAHGTDSGLDRDTMKNLLVI